MLTSLFNGFLEIPILNNELAMVITLESER